MTGAARPLAAAACAAAWLLLVAWTAWRHHRLAPEAGEDAVLVAYASQTGTAEAIARATAAALAASGRAVALRSFARLTPAELTTAGEALFVAATTGEGDPPDDAAPLLSRWPGSAGALAGLRYAVLALGDRHYREFCGFGHALNDLLREAGATAVADLVEVDAGDPAALRQWQQTLRLFGAASALPDWEAPRYERWQLERRELLNPGSPGAPLYWLWFTPRGEVADWAAGDIAEVYPGPAEQGSGATPPLPHRDYSIASIPEERGLALLVRLFRDDASASGLGSGWLCERAVIGEDVALRIRPNARFHAPAAAAPMVLIGNGTGLSALRAHLRARSPGSRNWLIYGERSPVHDRPLADELDGWARTGHLRLTRAFSRGDPPGYVGDAVAAGAAELRDWIDEGASIYVCGSVAMGNAVDAALRATLGPDRFAAIVADGRYRRDIY